MKKLVIISVATVAVLTFSGCGNSSKEETTKTAVEATKKATEATKEVAAKTTDAVKEGANKAVEATKEAAGAVADKAKEAATKTTDAVKEGANKAKEAASDMANKAKEAVAGGNEHGKAVFAKCVSCHGADGKTKALGKSEVIAGQNVADLEKKIQEYKAGTRNVAGMGMLMKGQVGSLSDDDIKAVAEYISTLK